MDLPSEGKEGKFRDEFTVEESIRKGLVRVNRIERKKRFRT